MHRTLLAFGLAFLAPSVAWAQSDNAARAQALFDQAIAESRSGDFASACPKFAASQKLDPKTSTILNLASCYELNGQTASAWASFKEAEAAARKYGRGDWADRAAAATKRLEPKLVHLTVHVPGSVRAAKLRVELDGTQLQETEWEYGLPIDPGPHRLDWSAPDFHSATRTVDVATRDVEVTLTELEPTPRPVVEMPPQPARRETLEPSTWTTGRVLGIVAGGIGVGGLVAGSVFGLSASSKYDDAEKLCGTSQGSPHVCAPAHATEALAARDDADSRATVSTVLFAVGGFLAAGGAVLFVLSPPRHRQPQVAIVPAPNGLAAVGRW